jgi:hypothetical protein
MASLIQKRLALKLKLYKIDSCGIAAPILLNEILAKNGYQTKLVQGYCSLDKETCWHIWIEIGSEKIDIGNTIACLHDKEFEKCKMILHTNLALGSESPKTNTETLDEWDIYKDDHKAFWKKQPIKVQNVRAKLLNEKWV